MGVKMKQRKIEALLASLALTWTLGSPAALAQQEPGPSTPGAIPDPSTYQGSKEIQRQQDVQDQQFRQQQDQQSQQFQQRQNLQGQQSAAGQPSGPSAREIWEKRPLVPSDHNALLGRWTTHAADTVGPKDSPLGDIGSMFGADVAKMASGMLQSVCDSMFGNGIVDFRAAALVSVGRDGRERVLTRVEYRGGGDRIAVLALDAGTLDTVVFDFKGHDRITAQEIGCAMARAGAASATTASATATSAAAPMRTVASNTQGAASGATVAVLNMATPLAGGHVFILKHGINAALANGGLRASSGSGSPMKMWHDACAANSPACLQGRQALVADTAAATTMDAGGKGQSQPVPVGRYYVFGSVFVAGRPMIWNMPIDLRAGINSVTLDMNNLTPVQ
jgi:hypothetical protein